MDGSPRGYYDLPVLRSYAVADDAGNLFRVEVREDPVSGLRIKGKFPMPAERKAARRRPSDDE